MDPEGGQLSESPLVQVVETFPSMKTGQTRNDGSVSNQVLGPESTSHGRPISDASAQLFQGNALSLLKLCFLAPLPAPAPCFLFPPPSSCLLVRKNLSFHQLLAFSKYTPFFLSAGSSLVFLYDRLMFTDLQAFLRTLGEIILYYYIIFNCSNMLTNIKIEINKISNISIKY